MFTPGRSRSQHVHPVRPDALPMGDFMAVLGIVLFVAAMLGLIWGLEHV
ncbi:MAG TPA: hypothetical protein VMV22_08665 [Acidimicrobiales bacterium]|nr:hypothetical protein [Acidimicrobiales bacterium]